MNAAIQSKFSYLKARKSHLSGLINLVKPKSGKTTKIETMTIAAIRQRLA